VGAQATYLVDREVDCIPAPVGAGAPREHVLDVRGALEVDVVQYDRHPVCRQHHVLLDEIRPHRVGEGLSRERVLRQVGAGPAMGDDQRRRRVRTHARGHYRANGGGKGDDSGSEEGAGSMRGAAHRRPTS
jgi:hypothetical protein